MTVNLIKKVADGIGQVAGSIGNFQPKVSLLKDVNPRNLQPLSQDVFQKGQTNAIKTTSKVSLARNPVWKCDIPCKDEYFYRTLGDGGYQDFLESGKIRPKQNTKVNYETTYFEKGHVNQIYAMRGGGGNYIVETNSPRMIIQNGSYPHVDELDKASDSFRIWHRVGDNNGTPHYEIVYDSM